MKASATHITAIVQLFEIFLQTRLVASSLQLEAHQSLLKILQQSNSKETWPGRQTVLKLAKSSHNPTQALVLSFLTTYPPFETAVMLNSWQLALIADDCSLATVKNYRSDIRQFIDFHQELSVVKLLQKPKVLSYLKSQATSQSKSTLTRKLSSITQFAKFAQDQGWAVGVHHQIGKLNQHSSVTIDGILKEATQPSRAGWLSSLKKPLATLQSTRDKTNNFPGCWQLPTDDWLKNQLDQFPQQTRQTTHQSASDLHTTKNSSSNQPSSSSQTSRPTALHFQDARSRLSSRLLSLSQQLNRPQKNQWLPWLSLSFALLALLGIGYFGYQQFGQDPDNLLAYPTTLKRPNRSFSFQGRLTDTAKNPIVSATNMQFKLYTVVTGGTEVWDSGVCSIDPDQDGIFSTNLGSDCGAEIPANVFSENANVWLEVTVASETLAPRQPIKTVAYALNSETLQGYPASASAVENTVLVMNNNGEVVLGNTSPVIKSTGTSFALEAQTMTIRTSTGSDGDIVIDPDDLGDLIVLGNIDAQAAATISGNFRVKGTSVFDNYLSAPGATLSATYAGGRALTLKAGPSATGDIMQWQTSVGTPLGVIDKSGNVGIGTTGPTEKLTVSGGNIALTTANSKITGATGLVLEETGDTYGTVRLSLQNRNGVNGAMFEQAGSVDLVDFVFKGLANQRNIRYENRNSKGSLTAPFFGIGGLSADNSTLNVADNGVAMMNGNVGIGTTSPSQLLDVAGDVEIGNYLYFANGGTNYLRFDGSDFILSNDFLPSANNTYTLGTNSSRWSAIYGTTIYQGANQVCDTSGNCSSVGNLWQYANGGISPATPYTSIADFYIGGDSAASAKFAFLNVNSGTPTASVSAGTAGATFLAANGNISTTARQNLTLGNSATYNTTGNILLNPNGTGNVGIGTTNPSSPLQVHGPSTGLVDILKISKAGGSTSYMSVFSNTSNSSNFDPSFLGFHGSGGSAALQFIGGMDAGNDSSGNSPLVSFQARRGGVSGSAVVSRDLFDFNNYGTSVMRINVSGYVGIGSTSPTAKLDIAGSASTSGTLAFRGTTDPKIDILNGENFSIRTSVGGDVGLTERLTILSNGNIGIGTTSPGSDMEIYKGAAGQNPTLIINAQGPGGVTSGINLKASTNNALITYNSWSPNLILQNNFTSSDNSVGYISFNTKGSTTPKMVILQNGNVGIGTTAPAQKLEVTGDVRITGLTASLPVKTNANKDLVSGAINLASAEVTGTLGISNGGTNATTVGSAGSVAYSTGTAYGFSSVGTTGYLLTSAGSGTPTWTDPTTVGTNYWTLANQGLSPTNQSLNLYIGGNSTASAKFRADANTGTGHFMGNVGIGTTSPGAALDINGNILFTKDTNRSIQIANATGTNEAGKTLTIQGAAGHYDYATTLGGGVSIIGGIGAPGGSVTLQGGQSVSANGGEVNITGGLGSINGGTVTIQGGTSGGGSGYVGGNLVLKGGLPGGAGSRGDITLGYKSTDGLNILNGNINIYGSNSNWWGKNPGDITIEAGSAESYGAVTFSGGSLTLGSGSGTNSTNNGIINIKQGTNSRIYIDGSGNVGIGTTAPAQKLEVTGDVRITGLTASLPVKTNANKDLVSGAINLASAEVTGTLGVGNGGTNATTVGSAGSIAYSTGSAYGFSGVGTTGYLLTSGGTGTPTWTDPSTITGTNYWTLANQGLSPTNQSLNLYIGGNSTASAKFRADASTGTGYFAGNVGIGTTSPMTPLHIYKTTEGLGLVLETNDGTDNGQFDIATNRSDNGLRIYTGSSYGTGGPAFQFWGDTSLYKGMYFDAGAVSGSDIFFRSSPAGSTAMVVKQSSGNVGIGTTTPDFKLQVDGTIAPETTDQDLGSSSLRWDLFANTINADNTVTFSNLSTGGIVKAGSGTGLLTVGTVSLTSEISGILPILNGGTNASTIGSAGSVPYSTGTAYGFSAVGNSGQCLLSGAGGVPTWGDCALATGTSKWQLAPLGGAISPYSNSLDLLLGGTASSSAKFAFLNVNSGTPTASIAGNLAIAAPTGANPATKLNIYNGGTFGIRTSVGGDAGLAERLTILNNGNVGIGTTNPAYKLSLAGTSSPGDRKVGINGTQVVYLPDQTSFTGSLIVGDGGSNLNHSINIDGYNNSIFGLGSGSALTSGSGNSVLGTNALSAANTGLDNVAVGYNTLNAITWSSNNTAVGANAGRILTDGDQNTLLGSQTGYNLTDGADNIFVGYQAGWGITTGFGNVVVGDTADAGSGASGFNVSLGYAAGYNATGGSNNVMLGSLAGSNIGGSNNILVGYKAGDALTSGTNNIAIGYDIDLPSNTGSNQLSIGNLIFGTGLNGTGTTISTGNIGIGTTAPSQKLDVNGGIRLGTAGAGNVLNTSAGSAPTGNLYWGDRTVCDSGGSCGTSGIYSNWTVNASNGTINPNNNTLDVLFGGTASSSAKFAFLNVNSGTPTASIAGNLAIAAPTGANPATKLNVYNGGSFGIQTSVGGDVGLAERLTILNNGNVGIGTTIPESSLDVRSTTNASIKIKGTNGQGGGIGLEIDNTTTTTGRKYQVVNYDNGDFVFRNTAGAGNDFVRFNDSNNLILLEDGGNVGIGTTSPSQKLHVDGSARITGALYDSSNSAGSSGYLLTSTGSGTAWGSVSSVLDGTYFKQGGNSYGSTGIIGTNDNNGLFFRTNNSNKMFLNTDGSLAIYENGGSTEFLKLGHDGSVGWIGTEQGGPGSNTPLVFRTAYFDRMYISTAGNVGIGTTSPSQKLHVDGSARITGALYDSSNSAGSSGSILTSTGSGTAWGSVSSIMDGTYFKQGGNSYGALATLGTNDSYGLALETNNTERVRIDTSGNVGIGTTSPDAALQVNGNIHIGTDSSKGIISYTTNTLNFNPIGNIQLALGNNVATLGSWGGDQTINAASGGAGNSNRAGINLVLGSGQSTGNGAPGGFIFNTTPAGVSGTQANPYAEVMRITGAGNVGIGTTAPGEKLEIIGNASVRNDSGATLTMRRATDNWSWWSLIQAGSGNAGNLYFYNNNTAYQPINFDGVNSEVELSGNVGIGTTNPLAKLQIGASNSSYGRFGEGNIDIGWNGDSRSFVSSNANAEFGVTAGRSGDGGIRLGQSNQFSYIAANGTSLILNGPGGNVGIGTTSPVSTLDVRGTGRFTTLEATSTGNALTLSGAGTNIAFTGAGPAQITTASNQHLALMPAGTGNVGIGTTSPGSLLHLRSANTGVGKLTLENTSSAIGDIEGIEFKDNGNTTGYLRVETQGGYLGKMYLGTAASTNNPATKMTLDQNGNVGIGTTSPGDLLSVRSSAAQTGITLSSSAASSGKIQLSWQDGAFTIPNIDIIGRSDAGYTQRYFLNFKRGDTLSNFLTLGGTFESHPFLSSAANVAIGIDQDNSGNGAFGIIKGGSMYNRVGIDGVTLFYVGNSGNVGIGTTSPSQKLHVDGSARITGALYDSSNSAGSSGSILTSTGSGTAWGSVSSVLDGTYFKQGGNSYGALATLGTNDSYGLALETNNTERMRIDTSGNVGIGTTAPSQTLAVNGKVKIGNFTEGYTTDYDLLINNGIKLGGNLNLRGPTVGDTGFTGLNYYNSGGDERMRFWQGSAEVMSLGGYGSVTFDGLRLNPFSNPNNTATNKIIMRLSPSVQPGSNYTGTHVILDVDTQSFNGNGDLIGLRIQNGYKALWQTHASATNYFAGNVGIGTTAPGAKLEVAGGIAATGITGFISSPYRIAAPIGLMGAGTGDLTSVGTDATGTNPIVMAVDPTGRFAYVANYGSDTVQTYTINQSTGDLTSVGTDATGTSPRGIAVDPTGRFVYVANNGSSTIQTFTINQTTGDLTSLGTDATGAQPFAVAVDPTGRFAYVTNVVDSVVQTFTINQTTGDLTLLGTDATGANPHAITVDPTGRFAYVANFGSATVQTYTINQSTGDLTSVGTDATGTNPYSVAVDPTGRFAYVTNWVLATVQTYTINQSTGDLTSVGTDATGASPFSVVVDPTGRFAYVTNYGSATVQTYTINQSTGDLTSVGTDATGTNPRGIAVDPTGRFAYVANFGSATVQTYTINNFSAGDGYFAGSLGIGTTAPVRALHVKIGTDSPPVRFEDTNGYCEINPTTTTWTCTSDARLKKDVIGINTTNTLNKLMNLRPVSFKWNTQTNNDKRYGFIAQEVESIFPDLVTTDEKGIKTVAYGSLTPFIISGMQEQNVQLSALTNSLTNLATLSTPLTLDEFGQLSITGNSTGSYQVTNVITATPINNRLAAFTQTITAIIEAGLTRTKELVVSGRAQIADLSVGNLSINGQGLREYVESIVEENQPTIPVIVEIIPTPSQTPSDLAVNTISTESITTSSLNSTNLQVTDQTRLGSLIVQSDATVAGTLNADQVETATLSATSARIAAIEAGMAQMETVRATTAIFSQATVSGTLYADTIANLDQQIAAAMKQPSLIDVLFNNTPSNNDDLTVLKRLVDTAVTTASTAAQLDQSIADLNLNNDDVVITGQAAFINQYLKVNGTAYVADSLGVGNLLKVGSRLELTDTYLAFHADPSDEGDLNIFSIQPSGKGILSLMAGLLTLDETGTVTIVGNLKVAGDVEVRGTLLSNLIESSDPNLPVRIKVAGASTDIPSDQISNPDGTPIDQSALTNPSSGNLGSRFEIIGDLGQAVATVSGQGKISLTGGINIDSDSIARPDVLGTATNSAQLTQDSTKTTGRATLPAGNAQLIIRNPNITTDSLVYLTPLGSTNNQVLFVKQITPAVLPPPTPQYPYPTPTQEAYFVVGLDTPAQSDITFTWWIVN